MKRGQWRFKYLEIGVAGGATLKAMFEILKRGSLSFSVIGIDLPNGWSLNLDEIETRFGADTTIIEHPTIIETHRKPRVQVYLRPAAALLDATPPLDLDFVLIDGCHEEPCVIKDFRAVSRHCHPGSIVCFHDAAESEQGVDIQPHQGLPIGVYKALKELGLFESNPHWKFLEWLHGDKERGGNSCACFQKL